MGDPPYILRCCTRQKRSPIAVLTGLDVEQLRCDQHSFRYAKQPSLSASLIPAIYLLEYLSFTRSLSIGSVVPHAAV